MRYRKGSYTHNRTVSPLAAGKSHSYGTRSPRRDDDHPRHTLPTLQCGVNKIQSLRDYHPEVLFCFCLTCLRAERFRNAEPKEIARTMWKCVSERHYLINPRLNAVQSGAGKRPSHHRTAGVTCHKVQHEPGAKWSRPAMNYLTSTHKYHLAYRPLKKESRTTIPDS